MYSLPYKQLSRKTLGFFPTPLVSLDRLTKYLGGPKILMKRDDQTGLALGGNKTRKLEFLIAEALEQGCDCVVTAGAAQSNHCRQTSAAATASGLECHLVLGGQPKQEPNGNLLLDYLFGANIHWDIDGRKGESIPNIMEALRVEGKNPYLIPYGGSSTTGAAAYVEAMREVKMQLEVMTQKVDHVIFASSSGGTQAGFTVGKTIHDLPFQLVGIEIDKGEAGKNSFSEYVCDLANQLAKRLDIETRYHDQNFTFRSEFLGEGYGVVSDFEREAIQVTAHQEGILLDPVYTGRAMGALFSMIRNKEFRENETVLFWHTGGTPALFDYVKDLIPAS